MRGGPGPAWSDPTRVFATLDMMESGRGRGFDKAQGEGIVIGQGILSHCRRVVAVVGVGGHRVKPPRCPAQALHFRAEQPYSRTGTSVGIASLRRGANSGISRTKDYGDPGSFTNLVAGQDLSLSNPGRSRPYKGDAAFHIGSYAAILSAPDCWSIRIKAVCDRVAKSLKRLP